MWHFHFNVAMWMWSPTRSKWECCSHVSLRLYKTQSDGKEGSEDLPLITSSLITVWVLPGKFWCARGNGTGKWHRNNMQLCCWSHTCIWSATVDNSIVAKTEQLHQKKMPGIFCIQTSLQCILAQKWQKNSWRYEQWVLVSCVISRHTSTNTVLMELHAALQSVL